MALCQKNLTATRPAPHKVLPGSLGRDAVCCSGYEEGRRRALGVVAALSTTNARPRRWRDVAAGTPMRHGGPEGR